MTDTFSSPTVLDGGREHDPGVDRESRTRVMFDRIAECEDASEIAALRERIVSINMRVADSLAHRYFGHGENNDDLQQVAYLGLVKAVSGFDPGRGRNFLSYAVPTITGELKRHFRDHCWTVRPPRRIQDLQREITAARAAADNNAGQPTIGELARALDIPAEQVTEALSARGCFSPTSLDAQLKSDTVTTFADLVPDEDREMERAETHVLLAPLLKQLPATDREILALRFFEEWTQEQIAKRFGTSQMQISRHLTRLMRQLRAHLQSTHPHSA